MDEKSKANADQTPEKEVELTPEELNQVAGGGKHEPWIEVDGF